MNTLTIINTLTIMKHQRRKDGFLLSALLSFTLLTILACSSLAMDISHIVAVQTALQNAVDAGALAGVQEIQTNGTGTTSTTNAQTYARTVTALNKVDGKAVSSSDPNTTVNVTANSASSPATVTVTATRTVSNIFASMFGNQSSQVHAQAIASTSQGLSTINPNQLCTICVALDFVPAGGPESNQAALNTMTAGQNFVMDLNQPHNNGKGNPHNEWNAVICHSYLSGTGTDTGKMLDYIIPGSSIVKNSDGSSWTTIIAGLQVGQTLNVLLFSGIPPGSQDNQSMTILGTASFQLTAIDSTNKLVTGKILSKASMRGKRGHPQSTGNGTSDTFIANNAPWTSCLIN